MTRGWVRWSYARLPTKDVHRVRDDYRENPSDIVVIGRRDYHSTRSQTRPSAMIGLSVANSYGSVKILVQFWADLAKIIDAEAEADIDDRLLGISLS